MTVRFGDRHCGTSSRNTYFMMYFMGQCTLLYKEVKWVKHLQKASVERVGVVFMTIVI